MKMIYEVFDEFVSAPTKQDKINVLRKNDTFALRNLLIGTYNPNVQFVIEKAPQYKPSDVPPGLGYTTIHQELGRVYLFEKNNPKVNHNLSQDRKEQLLIGMLEALEKREAEVFLNMILKKQNVPGLNKKIVNEAFPGLIP